MDFHGIAAAVGSAACLLGSRLAGLVLPCRFLVDRARPGYRVPCHGLDRNCGSRQGDESIIVVAVELLVEGSGAVPVTAGLAPIHIHASLSHIHVGGMPDALLGWHLHLSGWLLHLHRIRLGSALHYGGHLLL